MYIPNKKEGDPHGLKNVMYLLEILKFLQL
jgi:hypothetical protein